MSTLRRNDRPDSLPVADTPPATETTIAPRGSGLGHPDGAAPPFPGVPPSERDLRAAARTNSIYYQGGQITAVTSVLTRNPALLAILWVVIVSIVQLLGVDTVHMVTHGLGLTALPSGVEAVMSSPLVRLGCNGAIFIASIRIAQISTKRARRRATRPTQTPSPDIRPQRSSSD